MEIGCGWGSLAIEIVKQTGCRYTGITLSEQQLKYAEKKVKDANLQVQINLIEFFLFLLMEVLLISTFLLCI